MLGRPEGAGADRLAMEVVVVIVRHVDATVVGAEHPMSNFLYFLLLCNLLLLFLPDLFSLTGVKGLESLSMLILLLLFIIGYFLPEGRKGLYLPASRGYKKSPGLFGPSCRYRCHPPSRWSSPHQPCLQGWHGESSESQSHSVPWG